MIVLVGCSGSGKSTISVCLEKEFGYKSVISYTTRPKRVGEIDGIDYHFISEEEFLTKKSEGFFIETAQYRDWHYGTAVKDCYLSGKKVAILTPHGLRQIKKIQSIDVVSFYIKVDRKSRMIKALERGDNIEEIKRRDASDVGQFDGIEDEVDFIIENSNYKTVPEFLAKTINFSYNTKFNQIKNRRLTILCDIDEVVNNLVKVVVNKYNAKYNDNLNVNNITEYKVDLFTKPECENVFKEFCNDETIMETKPEKGCIEAIEFLIKNHNFYFVTSTFPRNVNAKNEWLKLHFPSYDEKHLIVCKDKHLIHGDILIDDCADNINNSVKFNIIYNKPWNASVGNNYNIARAYSWTQILSLIENFSEETYNV